MSDDSVCVWTERVSALLDGELPADEVDLVRAHTAHCRACSMLGAFDGSQPVTQQTSEESRLTSLLQAIPAELSAPWRLSLAIVGVLILVGSLPDFVRGNSSGDALHDLRHLAIWQVSIGLAALAASVTFRLSRLFAVMVSSFLGLTAVATVYDIATGHRGPWTDPVHIVEVAAVLLLLRVGWPLLRTMSPRVRRQRVR